MLAESVPDLSCIGSAAQQSCCALLIIYVCSSFMLLSIEAGQHAGKVRLQLAHAQLTR